MSATLIAAIPLALLGVVALLGFVGCILPVSGLPGGPVTHTDPYDDMMKKETTLVAFWTLTEAKGAMTATDQTSNHFDGTYQGGFGMTNYNGATASAAASGDVTAGQAGIVAGDALDGVEDTSAFFDGGIVFRAWESAINMSPPFTVEAWVKPDPSWTTTQPALRGVVVSNHTGPFQGFGLFAMTDNAVPSNNIWQFSLGAGAQSVGPTFPIDFTQPVHHVVGTLDENSFATLYVNGGAVASFDMKAMGQTYVPLQQGTQLFIGAGLPQLGIMSPPQLPLIGNVQCVAIYSSALEAGDVQTHFSTGTTGE